MTLLETILALDGPYVVFLTREQWIEIGKQGFHRKTFEPTYFYNYDKDQKHLLLDSPPPRPLLPDEISAAVGVLGC